jgi:hypothetical protein
MKTKITLVVIILVGIWLLNKVRIIVFASTSWLLFWMVIIGVCVWLLSGGISRVPAIRKFIEKYDK